MCLRKEQNQHWALEDNASVKLNQLGFKGPDQYWQKSEEINYELRVKIRTVEKEKVTGKGEW